MAAGSTVHRTFAALPAPPAKSPYRTYLAGLKTAESRRTKAGCLDRLAGMLTPLPDGPEVPSGYGDLMPWWELRYEDTAQACLVLAELHEARTWSASHVDKHLSALRRVLEECWRLGLLTADERDRACDFKSINAKRGVAGRHVQPDEFTAMIEACLADSNLPLGLRDAAIIAVLESTGARRSEVAGMLIQKYFHRERTVSVSGKGNKDRKIPLHAAAVLHIDRWVAVTGKRSGPLFRAVDRWGHVGSAPLSARTIGAVVAARRLECGLDPMTTHDPRRTLVGNLLDGGTDLVTVSKIVGHESTVTTAGYDRRDERTQHAAIDRLPIAHDIEVAARLIPPAIMAAATAALSAAQPGNPEQAARIVLEAAMPLIEERLREKTGRGGS